ncbi:hypothetical protein [Micromonospora sp. NPDC005652]|uniref:hypothetical protein n=1 Tax=Micromonospora sp. NPDC005652 TaxID=3157046 RepID=UPI0033F7FC12
MSHLREASSERLLLLAVVLCLIGAVAGQLAVAIAREVRVWRDRRRWRRWLAMEVVDRYPPRQAPDSDREDQA